MALYVVDLPPGGEEELTLRARRLLDEAMLILAGHQARDRLAQTGRGGDASLLSPDDAGLQQVVAKVRTALAQGDVVWAAPDLAQWTEREQTVLRALLDAGVQVLPVPGGRAWVACLVVSGLPSDRFAFLGEMPARAEPRGIALRQVAEERHTLVWRVRGSELPEVVDDVRAVLGDRQVALCNGRGVWRGPLYDAPRERLDAHLVVEGAGEAQPWTEAQVRERVREFLAEGTSTRDVARAVADAARWPRRKVYQILLETQGKQGN
jgi:16S rRNA (cytidine1402-2'-O)-methyltransferase